ncbi:malate dehydrogenase (quinone) [Timonella senegalensis]|uniref:malate dehydrogenase (quinone) n=1 Tax=Timonella senegalensis TaxID=1465825 RepID=UPI002FE40661
MAYAKTTGEPDFDVVLIGGGIMSVTLGALLHQLEPNWKIRLYERLSDVALESSNPWNNAGTGHAALCELNYTPEMADGSINIAKAVSINDQYQLSREFWDHLVAQGNLDAEGTFLSETPHMTFVSGEENVDYLRRRWEKLRANSRFENLEFSSNPEVISKWAPLLTQERFGDAPIAATRAAGGTDVNFGRLTVNLASHLEDSGVDILTGRQVSNLKQRKDGIWNVTVRDKRWNAPRKAEKVSARFVFVGAGGGALPLLQKSGIPEIKGYGGFPISGQFMRTTNPEIVAQHNAKVYGKASVGSPPMSVPHLDTRVVDGETSLLFGPYAGFSTKFLKSGSLLDLFGTIKPNNILTMLSVAKDNWDLTRYLITEVTKSDLRKFRSLKEFMPTADPKDWEFITAGQRVQVMKTKPGSRGGMLEFGTELVSSADGTIAGLLGASPGASTAVAAMVSLLEKCFPDEFLLWENDLNRMMPSLGTPDLVASAPKTREEF